MHQWFNLQVAAAQERLNEKKACLEQIKGRLEKAKAKATQPEPAPAVVVPQPASKVGQEVRFLWR